jgi:hypothetical protein
MSDIKVIDRMSPDGSSAQVEAHMPDGQRLIITYANREEYARALHIIKWSYPSIDVTRIESFVDPKFKEPTP